MNVTSLVSCTLTELALSVDNVMVWALILEKLHIPVKQQRWVLAAGIGIAYAVRLVAILAGAAALQRFAWLTFALGGLLIWTAYRVLREADSETTVSWAQRISNPAVAGVLALGAIDVVFAVDSIPASFGITTDPATIIVANAIALTALYGLYAVVSRLMAAVQYLTHGLAVILAYIGVGMLFHGHIEIPTAVNLLVIAVVLAVTVAASFLRPKP